MCYYVFFICGVVSFVKFNFFFDCKMYGRFKKKRNAQRSSIIPRTRKPINEQHFNYDPFLQSYRGGGGGGITA